MAEQRGQVDVVQNGENGQAVLPVELLEHLKICNLRWISMAEVASSRSRTVPSWARVLAMITRCFCRHQRRRQEQAEAQALDLQPKMLRLNISQLIRSSSRAYHKITPQPSTT